MDIEKGKTYRSDFGRSHRFTAVVLHTHSDSISIQYYDRTFLTIPVTNLRKEGTEHSKNEIKKSRKKEEQSERERLKENEEDDQCLGE